jgi:hypothetical protein
MISTTPSGWLWMKLLPGWRMSGVETFEGFIHRESDRFASATSDAL